MGWLQSQLLQASQANRLSIKSFISVVMTGAYKRQVVAGQAKRTFMIQRMCGQMRKASCICAYKNTTASGRVGRLVWFVVWDTAHTSSLSVTLATSVRPRLWRYLRPMIFEQATYLMRWVYN